MKLRLLFATTLLSLSVCVGAQVSRGLWDYGPVVTTTNNIYGLIFQNVTHMVPVSIADDDGKVAMFINRNRWWIPTFRNRFAVMQSINTPAGHASVKWGDWGFRNYALGYHVGYLPYLKPVGFDLQVDYEKQSWRAKFPGQDEFVNYNKQVIAPTLLMRLRLGSYAENAFNLIVDAGARYNHTLSAKGVYDDKDAMENGVTGVFGLGLVNPTTHMTLQLRYEHDFFNYFDKSFSPDGVLKPYEDVKTKHGVLNLFWSMSF